MTAAEFAVLALVLGILGFITSLVTSIVVAVHQTSPIFGFAGVLIFFSLLLIFFAFFRTADSKLRWLYIWTALLGLLGGIPMCFQSDHIRVISHKLTLTVLYSLTAMAISTLLSTAYPFFTRRFLATQLELAQLSRTDELVLYFAINLLTGLLSGVIVAASNTHQRMDIVDGNAIVNSIGIWVLNALLMIGCGLLWPRPPGEMESKYDSGAGYSTPEYYTETT
jgi:hypothetical protein